MKQPSFFTSNLLGLILLMSALSAQAQTGYTITDLGSLAGDSYANGINNSGQVVGTYYTQTAFSAFVNTNGKNVDLGNPGAGITNRPDLSTATAEAINDSGQIVGQYSYTVQQPSGLRTGVSGGYLYQNGQIQTINLAYPRAINNAGQIVGQDNAGHAALYQNGIVTELNIPTKDSSASAINSNGTIAGITGTGYAFSYQNGIEQILPPLDSTKGGSTAYSINDNGIVVGFSGASDNHAHATFWQNGVPYDIGTQGISSQALGINNQGQVVGFSFLPNFDTVTFVYQNGHMSDPLAGTGWYDGEAQSINDSGDIVGYAVSPSGYSHAFLATPNAVPAPGSLLTFGVGVGIMGFAVRRRKRACVK